MELYKFFIEILLLTLKPFLTYVVIDKMFSITNEKNIYFNL